MDFTLTDLKNKHLTEAERYCLEKLLQSNTKVSEIAKILGRHRSSIYREIKRGTLALRNSDWSERKAYSPYFSGQVRAEAKKKTGRKPQYNKTTSELFNHIQEKLDNKYSPDVIAGILKREGKYNICTQTIYNYINNGRLRYKEYKKRCRRAKKVTPRIAYNNTRGRSIEKRPFELTERIFGHWEMDTVLGMRGTKGALLVLTERLSRHEIIAKLADKTQNSVKIALDGIEQEYGSLFTHVFKSITVDNGTEFLDMESLEQSICNSESKRTTLYYAHPFCSHERGSNENNNKLIRKFIKKQTDIGRLSHERIKKIEEWMNNYPRKIFGYRTSKEIFEENLAKLCV